MFPLRWVIFMCNLVVLDTAEDSRTQIIFGRPLFATAGCKIDVKEGKLTFDVGEHHVEFGLFKDFESSPSTFSCCGCEVVDSNELVSMIEMSQNDPSSFDCTLFKGSGLDNVKVDSFPPSIVETKSCAVDEGYVSACCRFFTLWMSMPPMGGGVNELDLDVEFDFGPYDGDGPKMIVFQDPSLE